MRSKKPGIKQLQQLAAKVLSGKATPAENAFLDSYYDVFDDPNNPGKLSPGEMEAMGGQISERLQQTVQPKGHIRQFRYYYAAASVVVAAVLSVGVYFSYQKNTASKATMTAKLTRPARPIVHGSTKAVLTLADGSKITLDDHSAGALAKQSGVKISKTADGQLVYQSVPVNGADVKNQFNTMETPRGGIYQVNLPDGTHVWLNSATKLTYPVAFTGSERRVELSGEAYFEVVHNAEKPFKVISTNQEIEVLGTHFNANTYADEPSFRTTLLQGSVKVTATQSGAAKVIKPGQQAVLRLTGIQIHKVDADNAIAWKTGLFRFENEPVASIMKKISRWYDVDIVYNDDVSDMRFGGTVSRFADINKVLSKLQLTNTIHFKIEGRRIIVMK